MIETRYKVRRRRRHNVREYGYDETYTVEFQDLVRQRLIAGRVFHTRVIDTEVIPTHALIDLACLGSTDWKSKWAATHPEAYAN